MSGMRSKLTSASNPWCALLAQRTFIRRKLLLHRARGPANEGIQNWSSANSSDWC